MIGMKIILKYTLGLAAAYFLAWTVSYLFIFLTRGEGFDFSYYFQYLALAWTFRAGELPLFIWLFSLIGFLPLAWLVIFLLRRHKKHTDNGTGLA
jgi:hypothetical protein